MRTSILFTLTVKRPKQLREEARESVPLYLKISSSNFDIAQDRLEEFFAAVGALANAIKNKQKDLPENKTFAPVLTSLDASSLNLVYQLIQNKTAREQLSSELRTVLSAGIFSRNEKNNFKTWAKSTYYRF